MGGSYSNDEDNPYSQEYLNPALQDHMAELRAKKRDKEEKEATTKEKEKAEKSAKKKGL